VNRSNSTSLVALSDKVSSLPGRHRKALNWFVINRGTEQPWPSPLVDGTLLASKAKGIYKPAWTKYALSIRQSMDGPYLDMEPVYRDDGTWIYAYYQENDDPAARDVEYTNLGLLDCMRDHTPIGVLRQVSRKPKARYYVMGLALVTWWDAGYFYIEGFAEDGLARIGGFRTSTEYHVKRQENLCDHSGVFSSDNIVDARHRAMKSLVIRRGQPVFRKQLLELYHCCCAISHCRVEQALEAAHIIPYLGDRTNKCRNGLLLRADVHTLFDLGFVAVRPADYTIIVSENLRNTEYWRYGGSKLNLPANKTHWPDKDALQWHIDRTDLCKV